LRIPKRVEVIDLWGIVRQRSGRDQTH
jgi:hypothetical protein